MAFNCSLGVCTGTGADADAVKLMQRTINRFATDPDIGFTPIAADGIIGPMTMTALAYALTSVNLSGADPALAQNAQVLIDQSDDPRAVAAAVGDIIATLGAGADQLGRPALDVTPAAVVSSPRSLPKANSAVAAGNQAAILARKPGITGGLFGIGVKPWMWWTAGGLAVAGIWWKMKNKRSKRR